MATPFAGFPGDAIDFFEGLEKHNNREWFLGHKDLYERACREPMKALVDELGPKLGPSKISRINRDMRFARDKAPYKTHLAAGIGGTYVSLSSAGLYVGTGMYKPDSATLEKFRGAIDRDASGAQLAKIVTSLRRKGYHIDTHERLASAPRGYAAGHPRIDLLRMKDIFAGKSFAPEPWLSTRKTLSKIERVVTDIRPLRDWLREHVQPRRAE
jgi:uncharacterized protein (TIGR02453 family)